MNQHLFKTLQDIFACDASEDEMERIIEAVIHKRQRRRFTGRFEPPIHMKFTHITIAAPPHLQPLEVKAKYEDHDEVIMNTLHATYNRITEQYFNEVTGMPVHGVFAWRLITTFE